MFRKAAATTTATRRPLNVRVVSSGDDNTAVTRENAHMYNTTDLTSLLDDLSLDRRVDLTSRTFAWCLALFVVGPSYAGEVSRLKAVYYVLCLVFGTILSLAAAVWFLSPNDRVGWIFAGAVAAVQFATTWTTWSVVVSAVPAEILVAYVGLSAVASFCVAHTKLRTMPVDEGNVMTDMLDITLSTACTALPSLMVMTDRRVALALTVARLVAAYVERDERFDNAPMPRQKYYDWDTSNVTTRQLTDLVKTDAFQKWVVESGHRIHITDAVTPTIKTLRDIPR